MIFYHVACILDIVFLLQKNLGEPAYSNFLDHTYLGDRKTTIREYLDTIGAGIMEEPPESLFYLDTIGAGIMEEEPPESLKSRYGG